MDLLLAISNNPLADNTLFLNNRVSYSSRFIKPSHFNSCTCGRHLNCGPWILMLLMLLLPGLQRGERVEIVRTGETNEPQRIRALLCGVCIQCRAHGTTMAAKSGPRRRQSCDLGK